MSHADTTTMLCIASFFKGGAFIEEAKRLGCHVILLTREKLAGEAWPMESVDERFLMPALAAGPNLVHAVSYLARQRQIDVIVPLDDFDVETVAHLREHLRLPGMGESAARYFRDKLAMRMRAAEHGIRVPEFVHVLNYVCLAAFMAATPPPWILKPRSEAGSIGLRKIESSEELWRILEELGDRQSFFLLERFLPGEVFHVDSIVSEGQAVFSSLQQYGQPPMRVMHGGGVFMTRSLRRQSAEAAELRALNEEVIAAMGLVRGVTHAEFIRSHQDGQLYYLEMAARVGGANIDRLVEAASGLNPWREWARIEVAHARGQSYVLPEVKEMYAGLIICLARQEWPDLAAYTDAEIVWRLHKRHHAGLLVAAPDDTRIETLLFDYARRFEQDFLAVAPPPATAQD